MRNFNELKIAAMTEGGFGLDAVGADEKIGMRRGDEESDHAYRMRLLKFLDAHMQALRRLMGLAMPHEWRGTTHDGPTRAPD